MLRTVWRFAAMGSLATLAAASARVLLVLAGLALLVVLSVLVVVVGPAVWSRKKQRRDAALTVLRSMLGRR
jgi:hypothetical protein